MWYWGIVLIVVVGVPSAVLGGMVLVYGAGATFAAITKRVADFVDPPPPPFDHPTAKWEVVPAIDAGDVVGYLVRWSQADDKGRYLWVGHYYAGPETSLRWCQNAAERDAQRKNEEFKMPWEFDAWPNLYKEPH